MGHVYAQIQLSNPKEVALAPARVRALVDSGATVSCVPESIAVQLQLEEIDRRAVQTADGTTHRCAYVGPLRIDFQNRRCLTGALVFGDDVILGAVAMEDMDVTIDMRQQKLVVPPERPNFAQAIVKRVRPGGTESAPSTPRLADRRRAAYGS